MHATAADASAEAAAYTLSFRDDLGINGAAGK
jgi:hypothetical protein